MILGSGLGALADQVKDATVIETAKIPGYPVSTVSGHKGRLVFGTLGGVQVVVILPPDHEEGTAIALVHMIHGGPHGLLGGEKLVYSYSGRSGQGDQYY